MRPPRAPSAVAHSRPAPVRGAVRAVVASLLLAGVAVAPLHAQGGGSDLPPRAGALARVGERSAATDMLSRYLAASPEDGQGWYQLGLVYLMYVQDWHARGHKGQPDAMLYLDFALPALEQARRLGVDSGVVWRGLAELERALVHVEALGWSEARRLRPWGEPMDLPPMVGELGLNLLNSCPANGVLVTGNDLETLAVWFASLHLGRRGDVLPVQPDLYTVDKQYRRRIAEELKADDEKPLPEVLARVAPARPVCVTPSVNAEAVLPGATWQPFRLARVTTTVSSAYGDLQLTEFARGAHPDRRVWLGAVRGVYGAAAAHHHTLCAVLRDLPDEARPPACTR